MRVMLSEPPDANRIAPAQGRAATAFFCSQACPGDAILKAQDGTNARGPDSGPVIGGFHAPVEHEV